MKISGVILPVTKRRQLWMDYLYIDISLLVFFVELIWPSLKSEEKKFVTRWIFVIQIYLANNKSHRLQAWWELIFIFLWFLTNYFSFTNKYLFQTLVNSRHTLVHTLLINSSRCWWVRRLINILSSAALVGWVYGMDRWAAQYFCFKSTTTRAFLFSIFWQ